MKTTLATLLVLIIGTFLIGCQGSATVTNPTGPTTHAAYQPADGRNLDPALQARFGSDPQWPADAARGGGGMSH